MNLESQVLSLTTELRATRKRANEMRSNPPFSQESNLIRVGGAGPHTSAVLFNYTVIVPPETEIHAISGSGDIEANGVKGPVSVTASSANISVSNVPGDVRAHSASGTISLASIQRPGTCDDGIRRHHGRERAWGRPHPNCLRCNPNHISCRGRGG